MGRFVNPDNSAFQVALNSKIYVDKTGLLEYTNSVLDTPEAYICNSRPGDLVSPIRLICWQPITAKAAIQKRCSMGLQSARVATSKSISTSMM